jgi:hypothetical protein
MLPLLTQKDGRILFEPAGEGVLGSFDKDGFTATGPLASLPTTGESSARAGVVRGFLRSSYLRGMWVCRCDSARRNGTPPEAALHECRDRVAMRQSGVLTL